MTPNRIEDSWASVEILQVYRNGEKHLGWFTNDLMKTTHYLYIYRFEDQNGDIEKCVCVLWKKDELKKFIDCHISVPYEQILEDAKAGESAKYYDADNSVSFYLSAKSREEACVLCTTLSDLMQLKSTRMFEVSKSGCKRLQKEDIVQYFQIGNTQR